MTPYSITYIDTPSWVKRRWGYRTSPPHNMCTPMTIYSAPRNGSGSGIFSWGLTDAYNRYPASSNFEASVVNKTLSKFTNKFGDSSSFGSTLTAELKETLGMVTGTVIRLISAAKSIKRLRFDEAARTLGLPYRERTIVKTYRKRKGLRRPKTYRVRVMSLPNGREVAKTLANGWLLYSYGIKPLAQDIYNGMDVLQRPLPGLKIRETSRDRFKTYSKSDFGFDGGGYSYVEYVGEVRITCGAYVEVNNPNLWLCNQMGLINPVQWANEAIPFSFVVDWFSNLSQVIGSLSDFAGLTVVNPWTSAKRTQSQTNGIVYNRGGRNVVVYNGTAYSRSTTLPRPKLVFKYERFSIARALNAISLLIGFLPKDRFLTSK